MPGSVIPSSATSSRSVTPTGGRPAASAHNEVRAAAGESASGTHRTTPVPCHTTPPVAPPAAKIPFNFKFKHKTLIVAAVVVPMLLIAAAAICFSAAFTPAFAAMMGVAGSQALLIMGGITASSFFVYSLIVFGANLQALYWEWQDHTHPRRRTIDPAHAEYAD